MCSNSKFTLVDGNSTLKCPAQSIALNYIWIKVQNVKELLGNLRPCLSHLVSVRFVHQEDFTPDLDAGGLSLRASSP